MARTQIDGRQVENESIQREDLNGTTPGKAVVKKVLPGTKMSHTKTGPDDGTGDVTLNWIGPVQRSDVDVTSTGQALIRKIIAGSGISISQTGVDPGTGDVTVSSSFTLLFATLTVPANTQSVTFTGLDFTAHHGYTFQSVIVNSSGGNANYRFQLNGTDGGTYDMLTTGANRTSGANLLFTRTIASGTFDASFVNMYYKAGSFIYNFIGTNASLSRFGGGSRAYATSPTSITIFGSIANAIGAGSTIQIFRRI